MIDIGECCMGLISEQEISPGTEVRILIKHVDEYTIHGKVVWSSLIRETPKKLFRMGIETSSATGLDVATRTRTQAVFGGHFGGGMDLQLGSFFMLGVNAGYNLMSKFKEPMAGEKDYSGVELGLGFSILIG